jgi:hypothetical protein
MHAGKTERRENYENVFDKPAPFVISIFFTTEKEKLVVSTFEISISVRNSFCPKSFYGIPQQWHQDILSTCHVTKWVYF